MTREEAVAVALSWKGTPYVMGGRLKGAGCDCATLLAEYLIEIGRVTEAQLIDIAFYKAPGEPHLLHGDWFLNTKSEIYLRGLMKFGRLVAETTCRRSEKALPGDLALFKVVHTKIYNHGGIVTRWPFGVHAGRDGVRVIDFSNHPLTAFKPMQIFDPFEGA